MNDNPLVSVVIPAYNAEKTIGNTIQSALKQTYPNLEVIVVDDGSTDNTAACIQKFNKIKYIYQQNAGAGAARNTGVKAARGEWIAFLDSDDQWHPRKIELQMKFRNLFPDLVMITNTPIRIRPGQRKDFPSIDELECTYFEWHHISFLRRNRIHTSSVVVKKAAFEHVGGCDETLRNAQDRDLWLKLLYAGRGICLDLPLTKYFLLPTGLGRNLVRRYECDLTLIDKWDNRKEDTLDVRRQVPINLFVRTKYAVIFTMVFKLLRLGYTQEAKIFWKKLRSFQEVEYPFLPTIPWHLFLVLNRIEYWRKRFKYGKEELSIYYNQH